MAVEVARESFPRRVGTFYNDVLAEMRKVAWPDRAQWVAILDGAITPEELVLPSELGPDAAHSFLIIDTTADEATVRAGIDQARRRGANAWVACAVFSPVRAAQGRAGLSTLGREAVAAACDGAREAVLLVFSNPRIVLELSPPSRIVWTYGEDAACQRAALAFLRGARPAVGRMPVRL